MANTLLTPTAVTREALRILHQKLNFVGSITRDYDDSYAKSGAKIGDTLKIRLPNQYTVRTSRNLSTQDTTENSVSLQVATQKGVDVTFNAAELGLSLDDFSKRIFDPAMSVLAANIEPDAMSNGQTTMTVATGTGTLNQGDVITIAGLKKAHPESKANTGIDMQFVVTSNYAGGAGTVNIAPAIYTSGPLQNVVAVATGATQAVTVLGVAGSTGTSMLYQEGAFAFATADLQMPQGVDFARREVLDGVSMRIVRQYSIADDTFPCRIDVLYGYKTIRPQLASRVHNN